MPPISCSVLPTEMRDTQLQFLTPSGGIRFESSSAVVRPDAVAQDFLTAYSYGPIEIAEPKSGSIVLPWRVRVESTGSSIHKFLISKGNETTWTSESVLFSYTGSIPKEIDLTFSSDGRAQVAVERLNSVWLYWFNSIVNNYVFERLAVTGSRTPRVILDAPNNLVDSDVVYFYLRPGTTSDSRLYYRVQRDRYTIEYSTLLPTLDAEGVLLDRYLEDVVKLTDSRIAVFYSDRNPVTAKWTVKRFETILYPQFIDSDDYYTPVSVFTGSLRESYVFDYNDSFVNNVTDLIPSGSELSDVRVSQSVFQPLTYMISCSADVFSGSLEDVRFPYTMYYGFAAFVSSSARLVSGSLEQHIGTNMFDKDSAVSCSVMFVTASLYVP